ncbi:SGNH/GDSL hydrolase family protein [Peptoniphilus stercorisuis]|uniref:Lysophospholipase L1-like esterase n=1 Tax=Peptoniphilus stercorisuis TaxID=1436965 RepID=A0ABS4KCW6_9FIRM|nr:GDSL-type esterase/lipase family protein [Peptoniphilus stercorisuis]MBP2025006.1 lysophospholipase L1-like esterase [Peptoniphilus stercorisuis]
MKICAAGDSIVNGFGVGRENSFINIKDNNIEILNIGENGYTSLLTLEKIKKLKNISGFNLLFIYVGINDFLSGYSLESVTKNIERIIEFAKRNNLILLISIPLDITEGSQDGWCSSLNYISTKNKLIDYRKYIMEKSFQENFYYIDFYNKFKKLNNYSDLFFDGIHPNRYMHNLMRDYFSEILFNIGYENGLL